MHASSKATILRHEIVKFSDTCKNKNKTQEELKEATKNFIEIHVNFCQFCEKIEDIFSIIAIVNISVATVMQTFSAYMCLDVSRNYTIRLIISKYV